MSEITKEYKLNDKRHREDGPAVEEADGSKHWYVNGQLHREDGPAVEYVDGSKHWYVNGQLHREDGPAVEYVGGSKEWYLNGQRHREDGPAVEWASGSKYWYLNGKYLTEEQFKKATEPKEIDTTKQTLEQLNEIVKLQQLRFVSFIGITFGLLFFIAGLIGIFASPDPAEIDTFQVISTVAVTCGMIMTIMGTPAFIGTGLEINNLAKRYNILSCRRKK